MAGSAFPQSLWFETATQQDDFPELHETVETEVCIVGGGFTGLSAALHLAETGVAVTLLEAAQPGWGASGRNGGQVIPGLKYDPDVLIQRFGNHQGKRLIDYAGGAPGLVFSLIEQHGIACDASPIGWIQPAHSDAGLETITRRAEQWRTHGAELVALDKAHTGELLGSEHYRGAVLDLRGGSVQPLSYARGLAGAASGKGARIFGNTPATAIESVGGMHVVTTPAGRVRSRKVVLATNGYTDRLWPGLSRSVIPVYSFQVATHPLPPEVAATILPQGHSASDTRRLLWYFRKDSTGRLIMGGRGRPADSLTPLDTKALQAALREVYPQIGNAAFDYHWGGRVAMTADHLPHFHELAPGVFAGLGFNGRGVAMATAMGKVLASAATGTPPGDLPIPASPLKPIPLHAFYPIALPALATYYRMLDRRERT